MNNSREVCTLYRRCLRLAFDWISNRDANRKFVISVRRQFDLNRSEEDSHRIQELKDAVKYLLWEYRHPEPYTCTNFYRKLLFLELFG